MDRQGALHVAEELDAGGVASLHVLVVGYLTERETGSVWSEVSLTYLEQIKCRKHASQVGVVDDEEVSNFPGLDVDG